MKHLVVTLMENPLFVAFMGSLLITVPILGIQYVFADKKRI